MQSVKIGDSQTPIVTLNSQQQTLVSPCGNTKTVAEFLLDEIFASGIETAALIIAPGTERAYTTALAEHLEKITFIEQSEPLGYGHAVLVAKDFIGDDRFLLQMSDHIYLSQTDQSCVQQLLTIAEQTDSSVSTVKPTHESKLPLYGTIAGSRIASHSGLYEVCNIIEKPTPTLAEQELIIPGLRSGHYLCFFGTHVLTPQVITHLEQEFEKNPTNLPLTPSLAATAHSESYQACEIDGLRFNMGEPYGLLRAQLGMALTGENREDIMSSIIELIAVTK